MSILSSRYPACPDPASIPFALRERKAWLLWRFGPRRTNGKLSKPPCSVHTGRKCDYKSPSTWAPFPLAYERAVAEGWGLGTTLDGDGLVGGDLDDCRNPQTGELSPWAEETVAFLRSYGEVTPSSEGVRLFAFGKLPTPGSNKKPIELYASNRFLTVTGLRLPNTPATVEDRPNELINLWDRYIGRDATQNDSERANATYPSLDDAEMIRRASAARNGPLFARLWSGDWTGYRSHSEADLALCALLAFWVGPDRARIERLFSQSGLARRKWARLDYRERTIRTALSRVASQYTPAPPVGEKIAPLCVLQCAQFRISQEGNSLWKLTTADVAAHLRTSVPDTGRTGRADLARARLTVLVELLWRAGGGRPFALATRWTGEVLGCSEATARGLIRAAVRAGVLVRVTADEDRPERHRARLADEYLVRG